MKVEIESLDAIRRYLLGQSPPEDAAGVEERFLSDELFYEELVNAEDELIDAYLAGDLSAEERERFENHFLQTPQRHEKLRFARHLQKYISSARQVTPVEAVAAETVRVAPARAVSPTRKSFWMQPWSRASAYSLAAAAVILIVVSVMVIRNIQGPASSGKILAVELTPGLTRGDELTKQITIPNDTATLQLDLRLADADAYQLYAARLHSRDGGEIFRRDNLQVNRAQAPPSIPFQIPANLLPASDYYVKLSGLNQTGQSEDISRYSFRITRN